ncbi:hypothetical protein GPA26_08970 [Aromatoleum petrolei]|uniref:Uncharacterized protein n=1 Tax=Aromatoleum petrolei TaxID=76116 RepID=A0ABX1MN43_9RHOO|nr:hypothetical protein [Aromatoleum petrolei]NMF88615.1 hypothetical protein [Aromatoleum petrolei]
MKDVLARLPTQPASPTGELADGDNQHDRSNDIHLGRLDSDQHIIAENNGYGRHFVRIVHLFPAWHPPGKRWPTGTHAKLR